MNNIDTKDRTVVNLDLVGYSDLCRLVGGSSAVMTLNDEIQGYVKAGLDAAQVKWTEALVQPDGDGAIVLFDAPHVAHVFSEGVHAAARIASANLAAERQRRFRIGAATGEVSVRLRFGGFDMAGSPIADAVRLQAATAAGTLMVERPTFGDLSDDAKARYSDELVVYGKREEAYQARYCTFDADAAKASPMKRQTPPGPPPRDVSRDDLRRLLDQLPTTRFDRLAFLLEMGLDEQPRQKSASDRRTAFLDWANDDKRRGRLATELRYLGGPLARYCQNLEREFSLVEVIGTPLGYDDAAPRLEKLYVEQAASSREVGEGADPGSELPSVCEVVGDNRRLVLLGHPGGGKSTLVHWIAYQFAVAGLGRTCAGGWPEKLAYTADRPAVPLLIVLRELKIHAGITWDVLWREFLDQVQQSPLDDEFLQPMLEQGQAFFLVDGLDEVGNVEARRSLREAIHEGMGRYDKCRWLLTSRLVGYGEVPFHEAARQAEERSQGREELFPVAYLATFDDERIRVFARNWYVCRAAEQDAEKKARELIEAVFRDAGTTGLGRIPFLLTLMALVHRNDVTLPNGRAKLYVKITDAYVEKRPAAAKLSRPEFPEETQWAGLAKVGLEMQLRRAGAANYKEEEQALFASGEDIKGWLAETAKLTPERAAEYLDHLGRRTGLLMPRGAGRYAFIHLSFLEFFAAWSLKEHVTSRAWLRASILGDWGKVSMVATREALARHAASSRWREVLVFVCELLAEGKRENLHGDLFPVLFGDNFESVTPSDEGEMRGALLARLVMNPHAGWDRDVGWGDPLRGQALEGCIRAELAFQTRPIAKRRYKGASAIVHTLLANETEGAVVLEALVEEVKRNSLPRLSLTGTPVADLTPLAGLDSLQSLSLSSTKVADLTPLAGLDSLQTLSLTGTRVADLTPLAGLDSLRTLSLDRTPVADLKPLSGLDSLRTLSLTGTQVADLTPLAGLESLKMLSLSGTRVADLTPLAGLNSLKTLVFNGTLVEDLTPLAGLNSLEALFLGGTPVADLTPLTGLNLLQRLFLTGTRVADLEPLAGLDSLQELYLDRTQVTRDQVAGLRERLPRCRIEFG